MDALLCCLRAANSIIRMELVFKVENQITLAVRGRHHYENYLFADMERRLQTESKQRDFIAAFESQSF
jgi:hypothetical protein